MAKTRCQIATRINDRTWTYNGHQGREIHVVNFDFRCQEVEQSSFIAADLGRFSHSLDPKPTCETQLGLLLTTLIAGQT
tara:strand:- start:147 stop:383 length:237 start_codon:yes stop_codon:yes gene_type:complete